MLNVDQSEYALGADAEVLLAVHKQSEPRLVDDEGITVPTGRHAFIGIKERRIKDQTKRNCTNPEEIFNLKFLQGEYGTYSESACLVDCIHTSSANNCGCIGARSLYSPDTAHYSWLPNCTLESVCCNFKELLFAGECNCSVACSSIFE